MSISPQEAKRIAKLARIGISDAEADKIGPELSNILGWIEQLSEVNTDNVEPLANVANIDLKKRKDEVTDGNIQQDVLANAPESLEGYYVVPKVVE
ncbi:MAG: Asp-tRNA(Asn)/Glu-tRNA(Gln) amidotransferase GatCAB subunit C [Micavibrio sp.]|jgi:aspartyl-tRNA(Asn)/glutamyl-tRNA(Gln) amidotransferase subunit C|nr:Asp-tRNA(Asn)/Glu-tRNA(Gln) amidotransferase GatCAB subunit C [Micavibrio sp.]|tara:strand:+ start:141 stop:428 length:288 start_codon:yes stop_codon:yes gene_type:complete